MSTYGILGNIILILDYLITYDCVQKHSYSCSIFLRDLRSTTTYNLPKSHI